MADIPHILYQGQWLRLVRRGHWESCERVHADGLAVLIIALTPADELLFVEQYRIPLGASTIEFPAGLVGDEGEDESLEDAARRELVEETGWEAGRMECVLMGPTSSGMSNERIALMRARDLRRVGAGGGVKDEAITVHAIPRANVPAWLMQQAARGCELDPKLWAGLWLLERNPDGTSAI